MGEIYMRIVKIEIDLNKAPYITAKWRECRENGTAVFIEDPRGHAQYKGLTGRNIQKSQLEHVRCRKPGCASLWYVDNGRGSIKGSERSGCACSGSSSLSARSRCAGRASWRR